MTLLGYRLLLRDYEAQQREWDFRFYRVCETGGRLKEGTRAGAVFPSLQEVTTTEEDISPEVSAQQMRALLQASAGLVP